MSGWRADSQLELALEIHLALLDLSRRMSRRRRADTEHPLPLCAHLPRHGSGGIDTFDLGMVEVGRFVEGFRRVRLTEVCSVLSFGCQARAERDVRE